MTRRQKESNLYSALIERIFNERYRPSATEVKFERGDLERAARYLKVSLPKNLGDVIYAMRYRTALPKSVRDTQPKGKEWVIEGAGRSKYVFKLVSVNQLVPNQQLVAVKIPDSTPEIVAAYALTDEQALLAKVRYNRLIDIFLGMATYSLQSHLRTSVAGLGQLEIDEVYVGVDKRGSQHIIPVQAKRSRDRLSSIQSRQDIAWCQKVFPALRCRAISAQFVDKNLIALFEIGLVDGEARIVEERHYKLVPAEQISEGDLRSYEN